MDSEPIRGRRAARRAAPHLVLLADTPLGSDSRVIKEVTSAVEHGWRVTVLVKGNTLRRGALPGVSVIKVKIPSNVGWKPSRRSLRWRNPLAARSIASAKSTRARTRAQVRLLRDEVDGLRLSGRGGAASIGIRRARLLTLKASAKVADRRVALTEAANEARKANSSLADKVANRGWELLLGDDVWKRLWPTHWNQEAAFGAALDELRPDVVHANDFEMLAIGARAKLRAQARGRNWGLVWDAREFLPGMSPWHSAPRWMPSMVGLEAAHARFADRVVTVSEPLARLLVDQHGLDELPAVVTNAPIITDPPLTSASDVRTDCGLAADVPLIVYSGVAAPKRGLDVLIEALPQMPGVHLALVVRPPHLAAVPYVDDLLERARVLGVADRVHDLAYVPNLEVVSYLSTATVGVFPGLMFLNHTVSLITKFMEYAHAGLPIVVSDLKTMADTVREHRIGEVFTPEDVTSYVQAMTRVLADPESYRAGYRDNPVLTEWTWAVQGAELDRAHRTALDRARSAASSKGTDR